MLEYRMSVGQSDAWGSDTARRLRAAAVAVRVDPVAPACMPRTKDRFERLPARLAPEPVNEGSPGSLPFCQLQRVPEDDPAALSSALQTMVPSTCRAPWPS